MPEACLWHDAAPTARRLGCYQCTALIFCGFGQHKAQQSRTRIAAPRPDAARLCAGSAKVAMGSKPSFGIFCQVANTSAAHLTRVCVKGARGRLCGTERTFGACTRAEQRPKAAAHRRAAPTARRFGCWRRNALTFCGFGQHKAQQSQTRIAAPRPDAARLCAGSAKVAKGSKPSSGIVCLVANTRAAPDHIGSERGGSRVPHPKAARHFPGPAPRAFPRAGARTRVLRVNGGKLAALTCRSPAPQVRRARARGREPVPTCLQMPGPTRHPRGAQRRRPSICLRSFDGGGLLRPLNGLRSFWLRRNTRIGVPGMSNASRRPLTR